MLTRKIRNVGNSLIITLPSQISEMYDLKEDTKMEIIPKGKGTLFLRKVDEEN